jgi:hypothetical protein
VAGAPTGLTLRRHRDLDGLRRTPWIRRALVGLLLLFSLAGVLNVFGQVPTAKTAEAPEATLEVKAPSHVRSGLFYELRFTIDAREELRDALLVLGRGWIDGITLNTIEPGPLGEASRNGELALQLGRIPAGDRYVLWVQAQVNPTTVARRTARAELYDGDRRLLVSERTLTVFP